MVKHILLISLLCIAMETAGLAGNTFETDVAKTAEGDLKITFIGHGSLMFNFGGEIIHVDPFSRLADYSKLPPADLILLTHEHRDHLDTKALDTLRTDKTKIILTQNCAQQVQGGIILQNGDVTTVDGLKIEAIPAYNLVHMRSEGVPYHPKGNGNGYVITFADKRIYVAGDTENTPEMKQLKDIDCAFLPINLPYTMTPEMVADAAKAFKPKVLYPYHYHFGKTDLPKLVELMRNTPEVEIRIRRVE
jgi:L-ascorbate metabolism protein UlaG (beta-lactamase superfamily)